MMEGKGSVLVTWRNNKLKAPQDPSKRNPCSECQQTLDYTAGPGRPL